MATIFPTQAHVAVYLSARDDENFSPLSLSPVAWWDGTDASTMNTASDGSGSVPTSGQDVGQWLDKVSNSPLDDDILTAPSWSGSVLTFDGSEGLREGDFSTNDLANFMHDGTGGTLLCHLSVDTNASNQIVSATANSSIERGFRILLDNSGVVDVSVGNGTSAVASDSSVTTYSSGIVRLALRVASSGVDFWLNGDKFVVEASPTGFDSGNARRSLTAGVAGNGLNGISGSMSALVLVDRAISDSEVDEFMGWTP